MQGLSPPSVAGMEILPRLHFISLPVGHAYLWHDPDGLTLIDTGLPGSGPLIW